MGNRATLADVAHRAGVSASTASVVFSGKVAVSVETRARVLAAAAELGYTGPDPRAASLRRGRSGIVGVVVPGALRLAFGDPVLVAVMDGIAEAVAPLGASLLLLRADGTGPTVVDSPVDAVVMLGCAPRDAAATELLRARGVPVTVIEGDEVAGVASITLDNREAQRQLAGHLRSLGHERVATVTLPWGTGEGEPAVEVTRTRLAGTREVFPDVDVWQAGQSSIDEGIRVGGEILARHDARPTAVIAQSDLLAAGIVRAALDAGLRVPEDVSVTGFDGITVDGLGDHVITTMVQPAFEKGRAAGEALVRMLDGGAPISHRFSCVFRAGTTTGMPRL